MFPIPPSGQTAATAGLGPIPARAGVGLKPAHYDRVLADDSLDLWFEVHPENYMGAGGPPHRYLEAIRARHALSFHAVGLSFGADGETSTRHLERLRSLIRRYEPALISDHLSWSEVDGTYLNDLLPLPYTEESLGQVARNIERAQEFLGRRVLIENPSAYLRFKHSTIPEPEFLAALARASGCGLLIDLNNIVVSANNVGLDPAAYVAALPSEAIDEYHLAGHHVRRQGERAILIDNHGSTVSAAVMRLYAEAIARFGPRPTLIEWDTDIPAFDVLLREAARADAVAARTLHRGLDAVPA